jgi:hypothetical protein
MSARLIFTILFSIAVVAFAACGDAEEEIPDSTESASPQADIPSISATPTGVQADWKAYPDTEFGFSFRYPPEWFLSAPAVAGGTVSLYSYDLASVRPEDAGRPVPPDRLKVEIVALSNPDDLALESWIEQQREKGAPVQVESSDFVEVGGVAGIRETIDPAGSSATQYFIPKDGKVHLLNKYPSDSALSGEFEEVLASFEFLPPA